MQKKGFALLEKGNLEGLEKRLREKGIVRCMMYRPLSDGVKKEGIHLQKKE